MTFTHFFSRQSTIAAACLAGTLCLPVGAGASTFTVDPTQVFLTAKASSRLLTLRNQSDHALRFQLTVFAWSQNERGEMNLVATQDIVFFPTLLTLAPDEERKVRIGVATDFAATEKTYRIFVEVCLRWCSPKKAGSLCSPKWASRSFSGRFAKRRVPISGALALNAQKLSFELHNEGTVHFVPDTIRVRGLRDRERLCSISR